MWGPGFGWGRGRGWGRGWGFGRGFGRGLGWGGNPYVCARFPWLPRWWWADPSTPYVQAPQQTLQPAQQPTVAPYYPSTPYVQAPQQTLQPSQQPTAAPYYPLPQQTLQPVQQPLAAPYYPLPPSVPPSTPEQEIEALGGYKAEIEEELKGIEARIKELRGT